MLGDKEKIINSIYYTQIGLCFVVNFPQQFELKYSNNLIHNFKRSFEMRQTKFLVPMSFKCTKYSYENF